jgi:hypothetical protein
VTLSRQQQAASFGIEGATVHRADLLQVLADALPVGIVILGKRCTEVRPDGDLAVARFADGSLLRQLWPVARPARHDRSVPAAHHRLKQAGSWRLDLPERGVLIWWTPSGRSDVTTPTEYPM